MIINASYQKNALPAIHIKIHDTSLPNSLGQTSLSSISLHYSEFVSDKNSNVPSVSGLSVAVGRRNNVHAGPMNVRRKFSRGGDNFAYPFSGCEQCKWTFTKRFTLSTPQRKFPMKARAPFAFLEIVFRWRCIRVCEKVVGYFCHPLQLLLNWRIIQYHHCGLQTIVSEFHLNYPQLRMRCSHQSVRVEPRFLKFSQKCFLHFNMLFLFINYLISIFRAFSTNAS